MTNITTQKYICEYTRSQTQKSQFAAQAYRMNQLHQLMLMGLFDTSLIVMSASQFSQEKLTATKSILRDLIQ